MSRAGLHAGVHPQRCSVARTKRELKDRSRSRRAGFAGLRPMCEGHRALPPKLEAALGPGSMKRIYQTPRRRVVAASLGRPVGVPQYAAPHFPDV
jgi:hypothetical protein